MLTRDELMSAADRLQLTVRDRRLEWKTGADSPTVRRMLDVRPGTRTLLSASADEDAARNVMADEPPDIEELDTAQPPDGVTVSVQWPFHAEEIARLLEGFRPSTMEDKWRIVTRRGGDGLRVCFLRSWTNQHLSFEASLPSPATKT